MLNVLIIAAWFLYQSSMEHKKLQKLCYYAQAWHCVLEGEPLFSDVIEAWVHGPVIPNLYRKYKQYGWQNIPQVRDFDDEVFSSGTLEVLKAVYDTYGGLTGLQLEALTHSETPWQHARGEFYPDYPMATCTNPISIDDMRDYYAMLYERAQND